MPIYDYSCRACGKTFEAFVLRQSDAAEVTCPGCGAREVERRISRPAAVSGAGAAGGAPARRGCGPVG